MIDQQSMDYYRRQQHKNRMIDARHTGTEQEVEENSYPTIAPPNHFGTVRYFKAKFQDLMTIFSQDDTPSIFLTFTANPKIPLLYNLIPQEFSNKKNHDLVPTFYTNKSEIL